MIKHRREIATNHGVKVDEERTTRQVVESPLEERNFGPSAESEISGAQSHFGNGQGLDIGRDAFGIISQTNEAMLFRQISSDGRSQNVDVIRGVGLAPFHADYGAFQIAFLGSN